MVPVESRDAEGVSFASLESLWTGIWEILAPEGAEKWSRDHHENWKFVYRHRKLHWFQKCYDFRSMTKNNEIIAENPFQNSGVTMRLWTLGRLELTLVRQYILLVNFIIISSSGSSSSSSSSIVVISWQNIQETGMVLLHVFVHGIAILTREFYRSVCPPVFHTLVLCRNGWTYH